MERFYDAGHDKDLIRGLWEDTLLPGEDDSDEAFEAYWIERADIGDPDGREFDDNGYEVYDGYSREDAEREGTADGYDGF